MTIRLIGDNETIAIRWLEFSDGALQCWVDPNIEGRLFTYLSFTVDPRTPASRVRGELYLLLDALKQLKVSVRTTYLRLNYLPYGRADRVFEKGNPNGLEVFCNDMADLEPDEIHLIDPHNIEKTLKYFRGCAVIIKEQWECFMEAVRCIKDGDVLCAPDKGAQKKTSDIQQQLFLRKGINCPIIVGNKKRDPLDGKILGVELEEGVDVSGKVVYITDDIADGMGTFIPLAEKLKYRGAKEVHLYVTHMIASKGLNILRGYIDKIHCYQIVSNFISRSEIEDYNEGRTVRL